MNRVSIRNATRSADLGDRVRVADAHWTRLRGMLGRPEPGPGEGLLLDPCRGVHMFGMRYPLDVLFLDGDGRVVGLCERLAPGRRSRVFRNARKALELPAGTIAATGTEVGDVLRIVDDGSD